MMRILAVCLLASILMCAEEDNPIAPQTVTEYLHDTLYVPVVDTVYQVVSASPASQGGLWGLWKGEYQGFPVTVSLEKDTGGYLDKHVGRLTGNWQYICSDWQGGYDTCSWDYTRYLFPTQDSTSFMVGTLIDPDLTTWYPQMTVGGDTLVITEIGQKLWKFADPMILWR